MHNIFLQDLAVVMMVAGLTTILFRKLKQPVVLGYVIAGVIIGPHTPPFPLIHNEETINTLSELGIVFLMFSLGLEFNLRKLRQVGGSAFMAAIMEILLMVVVGYHLGRAFGWKPMDSLFLGAMLSISSTTIIVKALSELGFSKTRFAELIFGILIIEDILAIVMIALLSGIAMTGTLNVGHVGHTVGNLAVFLATALVIGLIAIPRFLGWVARFKSEEVLLITVLGLCFGFSLLATKLGYSVALGSFVIGAVISECRDIGKIRHLVEPIRDLFSAVFFVSIGLMIDPMLLVKYTVPILAISVVVIVGKIISCSLGTFAAGSDVKTSLRVGMGLAQIGEFSFIIAALGTSLKVTSDFLYPIAVAVSALTTLTTPYLIQSTDRLVEWFETSAPRTLVGYLDLYTRWAGSLGESRDQSLPAQIVRRLSFHIGLNLALIAAVFVTASYLGSEERSWIPDLIDRSNSYKTILWLISIVLTLPLYIGTFLKLQALGLMIAEVRVTEARAGARTEAIQKFVAQAVPFTGLLGMALFTIALSSALLSSLPLFLGMITVTALLTWLLWRSSIRIYSKAQIALEQTFAPQEPESEHTPIPHLPPMLKDADLGTFVLSSSSWVVEKEIREIGLRTQTGASIVAIERNGATLINPDAFEKLLAGDQLLLLGSHDQVAAARKTLTAMPATAS